MILKAMISIGLFSSISMAAISGKVTDIFGAKAISGALVQLENGGQIAATDAQGMFSIDAGVGTVDKRHLLSSPRITVSLKGRSLRVNTPQKTSMEITAHDLAGKVIFSLQRQLKSSGSHTIVLPACGTGVQVVTISTEQSRMLFRRMNIAGLLSDAAVSSGWSSERSMLSKQIATAPDKDFLSVTKAGYIPHKMLISNFDTSGIVIRLSPSESSGFRYFVEAPFNDNPVNEAPFGWTVNKTGGATTIVGVPSTLNKSLKLSRTISTGILSAALAFTPSGGSINAQVNFKVENTNTKARIELVDADEKVVAGVVNKAGKLYAGNATVSFFDCPVNIWNTIRLVLDSATRKYDVYLDAMRVLENADMGQGTLVPVKIVLKLDDGSTGSAYFDNVLVTPSTIRKPAGTVFDVRTYGAKGDGVTKDTKAIQDAINACTPGGTVLLSGGTFLSATIRLKSDMTLFIERSATLKGTQDNADYPSYEPTMLTQALVKALVYSRGADNLVIDGGGTIHGNGTKPEWCLGPGHEAEQPCALLLTHGKNITVRNMYLTRSAMWTFPLIECDTVSITDVNIYSPDFGNRDGIDICDCHNTVLERTCINSDDDAICPKTGTFMGVVNLSVKYCNIGRSGANGIKCGTHSYTAFKNLKFQDVYLKNVHNSGIALESVDGADISNITYKRIHMEKASNGIFVVIGNRLNIPVGGIKKTVGSIDSVYFEAISGDQFISNMGNPITGTVFEGKSYKLKNLVFKNNEFVFMGGLATVPPTPRYMGTAYPEFRRLGNMPAWGYYIRHAENVAFKDCKTTVSPDDARKWLDTLDVIGLKTD